MDNIEIVKAYYAALDSTDEETVDGYISERYRLVDFAAQPMDRNAILAFIKQFKDAFPNLSHSLGNVRMEGNVVKLTVQLAGTNSKNLDLRNMGIGIIPRSRKFVIFPNSDYEFTIKDEKIDQAKVVSAPSPYRGFSGMLKELGVNLSVLKVAV